VLVVWTVAGRDVAPAPVASPSATTTAAPGTTSAQPSAPPAPPAPLVDAAALPGIVVPLPDLRNLIGDQAQAPLGTNDTIGLPPPDQGGNFSDTSCVASFYDGTPNAYDGTNWRNVLSTASVNGATGQQVGQSVVRFDDAGAAQKALAGYLGQWRACGGKTTGWTLPNGMATTITYGAPVDAGNGITSVSDTVSGTRPGLVYVRVIAAKQNIVVDNTIVGVGIGDMPIRVTQAMLDRIKS
jgi:eukaryotic-like serine/threonine-protein kinase